MTETFCSKNGLIRQKFSVQLKLIFKKILTVMNFTDSIDQIKQRYQVEDSTNINTTQKTTQSELTLTIN